MKTIVVSAVNLRKGGTLTILRDCLKYLSDLTLSGEYKIVALVHKKELALYPNVTYIEMPWTMRAWPLRLWCEYVTMHNVSKRLSPVYLWLSLHDTTPNVKAERQAVYCHNPFPFYPWKWGELFLNYHIVCFAWFSKYIYRINIHRNNYVLVQQQWIRSRFIDMFRLSPSKVIVTLPDKPCVDICFEKKTKNKGTYTFLYPSYGDIHKNFEVLCKAASLLEEELGERCFSVIMTISGEENKYTRNLYNHWHSVKSLVFAGFMDRKTLYQHYFDADCLIFPSKVETWGLPISEFAAFDKPMLLADLPYARETAAGSSKTAFFDITKPSELKDYMKRLIQGDADFLNAVPEYHIAEPMAKTWKEMFDILLG